MRSCPPTTPAWPISWGDGWLTWLGTHPRNDKLPGDPDSTGRELTAVAFVERALDLVLAFTDSLRDAAPGRLMLMRVARILRRCRRRLPSTRQCGPRWQRYWQCGTAVREAPPTEILEHAVLAIRDAIDY